jgi:cyclohexanecarboxylate-CoA ligase
MIDRFTAAGLWRDRVITDYVDEFATKSPDKLAIIDQRGSCTYRELQQLSLRCAAGFLRLGLGPQDVVSLQLPNAREWVILHLAATRIGAITNPLVPMYRERELDFMLRLAESRLLVVPDRFRNHDHAAMAIRLREMVPSLEQVMVIGEAVPEGCLAWRDFIARPWERERDQALLAELRPEPNEVTELIYTSGTTGEPKAVLHTSNTIVTPQIALGDVLGLTSDDVLHVASTFGHQTGFLGGARLPFQLGATVVYQDVWDPEAFLDAIGRHHITISNGGPTYLQDMLRAPGLDRHDLSSLRIFRCGGAPIPRALVREAKARLPHLSVHSGWGQSENAVVTMTRPGDPEAKIVETDGQVQPGMQVRVVDTADLPAMTGVEGRLQCRGAFLFVGYARRPDLTTQSFVDDWFDTGDLAAQDADGFVRITGRTKDIIIRGGENIPVAYVENTLYENPAVQDVAVVAMPDERLGERACAFVVLRPDAELTMATMQAHMHRSAVAKQYWPERLEIVTEMPRAANGKIRKADLRARLAGG